MTATTISAEYGVRVIRRNNVWLAVETVPGGLVLAAGATLDALKAKLDRLFN